MTANVGTQVRAHTKRVACLSELPARTRPPTHHQQQQRQVSRAAPAQVHVSWERDVLSLCQLTEQGRLGSAAQNLCAVSHCPTPARRTHPPVEYSVCVCACGFTSCAP